MAELETPEENGLPPASSEKGALSMHLSVDGGVSGDEEKAEPRADSFYNAPPTPSADDNGFAMEMQEVPTRARGFSQKVKDAAHRLTHKKETVKHWENWPKDHPYSYTIGEIVKKPAVDLKTGESTELWFAHPDCTHKKKDKRKIRKVFISFKIKRVSEIDNVEEKFRVKFHMYFNWLCTEAEYLSYLQAKEEEACHEWEPRWYPRLEVQNKIEDIDPFPRWEVYPDEGRFRFSKFKKFLQLVNDDEEMKFNPNDAYFIRAKWDVEMELSEELELHSFPFDCQDLSIIMRENSQDASIIFLPEMRKKGFGSVDPRYSVIDEWDMEAARIELGTTNAGSSRSSATYPSIIIRLKMKRRWAVFMWNIVGLMFAIEMLALTSFSLDPVEDAGDRFGLALTLVLTAVVFLEVVKMSLPTVPYLTFLEKYVLSGYIFLMSIMVETAILKYGDWPRVADFDRWFLYAVLAYFVVYQLAFGVYAVWIRRDEINKLIMDSDEIERDVNQSRPALKFSYLKGKRTGNNGRLLSFMAMKEGRTAK